MRKNNLDREPERNSPGPEIIRGLRQLRDGVKTAKPTPGEKIAATICAVANMAQWMRECGRDVIARRIDRAIARAVKKERERCIDIAVRYGAGWICKEIRKL